VMFSKRFQDLQKLVNQTNRLVNENIEELLKQSQQQRRKIDDFEAKMQKFLMGYVSTVKGKIKEMQTRLDELTRVVAAEIRDRKQNQEVLEEKLGEIENKSEGCIEIQKKEVKETYAFFAKQMEQILADTHKALEYKRANRVISRDELKAFEKRYAKDMETLFYLVASLGDGDISMLPQSGADLMKKLQREEPLLQATNYVKRFSPTKHTLLDISLSDSNSETCDAERALTKFLQEGSPSNEKDKVPDPTKPRLTPKKDSGKKQGRPMSQMSYMSNLERKCTTHFTAEDVNVAELFASGPIDPEISNQLLDSNFLQCVGDLPTVENTQALRTSPVFLTPIPVHKRQITAHKSLRKKLDLPEIENQVVQQKTAPASIAQDKALSNRSQKRSIDLPALKSNRTGEETPSPNAPGSESAVLPDPISENRYPVMLLPESDKEEHNDTDNQLDEAEAAFGLNAGFENIDVSPADSFNVSLPKSHVNGYPDAEADGLRSATKPDVSSLPGAAIVNERESNDAPYEEEDFETPHISDDPFEGLLDETGSEVDDLQQMSHPVSSGAGRLQDIKIEETPDYVEEQQKLKER